MTALVWSSIFIRDILVPLPIKISRFYSHEILYRERGQTNELQNVTDRNNWSSGRDLWQQSAAEKGKGSCVIGTGGTSLMWVDLSAQSHFCVSHYFTLATTVGSSSSIRRCRLDHSRTQLSWSFRGFFISTKKIITFSTSNGKFVTACCFCVY
jgi:hypothetical protein